MTDEPITFGEPGSPETNKIRVELGKPFQCPCGCVMEHGDHWVAAHWGEQTKIEWTDHTWNPWRGCEHATLPNGSRHPGCDHCYAEALAKRNPATLGVWGAEGRRVVAAEPYWGLPEKWNAAAEREGVRRRVFCASLSDVFEEWGGQCTMTDGRAAILQRSTGQFIGCNLRGGSDAVRLDDVRRRVFGVIDATPWLDWLLLTKRPENVHRMWSAKTDARPIFPGMPGPLGQPVPCKVAGASRSNVWIGTSVSDQATADAAIPKLLKCRGLSPVLFLSCEPLVGPVDLSKWLVPGGRADWQCQKCGGFFSGRGDCPHCHAGPIYATGSHAANKPDSSNKFTGSRNGQPIDWVIVGGESGPNARPCDITWIRSIVDQCLLAGVPCFVSQLGSFSTTRLAPREEWPGGNGLPSCGAIRFHGDGFGNFRVDGLRDKSGSDPAEWPEDLRVREYPQVRP